MTTRSLPTLLMLACTLLASACSLTPTAIPPTGTAEPVIPPPPAELTYDMLANFTWLAPVSGRSITLVDGAYASGSDSSAADFLQATLDSHVALGDLDYDGDEDAAILLAENMGGTGVFVSLIAVLNNNGVPLQAASVYMDDRPMINDLQIQAGEVLLDAVLHGATDPMCCPSMPVVLGYRLYNLNELVLTRRAGQTSGGAPRQINIASPADLADAAYPVIISGSVTIGPFENTLAYNVFTPDNTLVTGGSVMTDSLNPGDPGNFTLNLDLSLAGVTGLVRVEFIEYSMMDSSIMSLDSVLFNIP